MCCASHLSAQIAISDSTGTAMQPYIAKRVMDFNVTNDTLTGSELLDAVDFYSALAIVSQR